MIYFIIFKVLSDTAYPHGVPIWNDYTRSVSDFFTLTTSLWNKKSQHSSGQDLIKLKHEDTCDFYSLDDIDKFVFLMSNLQKPVIRFIYNAIKIRTNLLTISENS